MKKIILVLAVLGLSAVAVVSTRASNPAEPVASLSYEMPSRHNWVEDIEAMPLEEGMKHFYFEGNEDIDLNISFADGGLRREIERVGLDEAVAQIIEGKHLISNLFGSGKTEVIEKSLAEDAQGALVLTIRSQEDLASGRVETLEKYFMYEGQTMLAALRWALSADESLRVKAASDFATLKITAERAP